MQRWHLLFSGTATGGGSGDNYHVQQGSVCACLCVWVGYECTAVLLSRPATLELDPGQANPRR